MNISVSEITRYIEEEDVKFIRLAFCDIFGRQKNVSIMPGELERAFEYGISIDGSAIAGFGGIVHSDLFLRPDPMTISVLPWRPEHGRVVRMFCDIYDAGGNPFSADTRRILKQAVKTAAESGVSFFFGSEIEFYLFKTDENGRPTDEPYDEAGYMDIAPEDKGENVRREICLTLEQMGIRPESSHHEEGPGQNEIDFRFADPLTAADNTTTFCSAVKTIAARDGLFADLSPKPISHRPGNGFHINISAKKEGGGDLLMPVVAGILDRIREMTLFLNRRDDSYRRLGQQKAPGFISWSPENRSQLIRIPAAVGDYRRAELRSPDPLANPYLAFALLIHAAQEGIDGNKQPPEPVNIDFYGTDPSVLFGSEMLPQTREEAVSYAKNSDFIAGVLPAALTERYCKGEKPR
ncbi:MAG: glutamine synthetase family protein [Bacillota bacterium]|jgi:glutamine synthetase